MKSLSRRAFSRQMIVSLFTLSLVKSACKADCLAHPVKSAAAEWLRETERVSRALKEHQIGPVASQQRIEGFYQRIELSDFLRSIDYEHLARTAKFRDDHESNRAIDTSGISGAPAELSFDAVFVALKKGVAVVPHAHRNMTSLHMVLAGEVHARSYDRVAEEGQNLIIRPVIDEAFTPGNLSTVSDQRHNVHWFKGLTGTAFMFNLGVFGIDPKTGFSGRDYIDPQGGEKLSNGLIRVRRIEAEEAFKLYGRA